MRESENSTQTTNDDEGGTRVKELVTRSQRPIGLRRLLAISGDLRAYANEGGGLNGE